MNFIYSRLFCCNHYSYCMNMVSVTSALCFLTSATRYHRHYQSRSSIYFQCLIPSNFMELAEEIMIDLVCEKKTLPLMMCSNFLLPYKPLKWKLEFVSISTFMDSSRVNHIIKKSSSTYNYKVSNSLRLQKTVKIIHKKHHKCTFIYKMVQDCVFVGSFAFLFRVQS